MIGIAITALTASISEAGRGCPTTSRAGECTTLCVAGRRRPIYLALRYSHGRTVTTVELADHCYIRADTVIKLPSIVLKREDDGSFHVEEREDEDEDDALGMFYSDYDEWSDELDAAFLNLA